MAVGSPPSMRDRTCEMTRKQIMDREPKILIPIRKKIVTVLAVTGALFFATEPRTTFTQSGPLPQVTLNVPSEALIGENFTFTVKFKNASATPGDIGYGPFIDLVLDAGGANINKNNPACACDGITFVKAEMVGVVGGPVSLQSSPVLAPCNPMPPTVSLSHPFASSNILPVTVPAGAQQVTLELPFGGFDPTQPEIIIEVTAQVSNLADAGAPLKISARGGFRYGTDPLDNPSTDPPILSDLTSSGGQQTDSTQWAAQATVTPTVITIGKKYLGPEDEAATGPNLTSVYPLQYAITVDIANGQTVSNVTVTDCFPNNLAFQSVVSVSPSGATVTPPPSGVPNNPPNNCVTVTWPSLTGASGPDATIVVDFFIPEKDANGNPVLPPNCQPVPSVNDVKAEGDWTPIDPCDTSPVHVVSDVTTSDHILADKCLAIQKKVAVFQDTGAPGPTPGDVLQYTLTFQISDFKTFGKLEIRDRLSDGQQFLPAPAPTLTVIDQFGTVSGPFIPFLDLFVTGDPNATCQGIKGTTDLVFMVSQKMTSLSPSHPRHLAGILTGGWATTPTSSVPATGQIVFYARIQDQFSFPQNHPGDRFVDKDDPLANCVTIRGEVLTNVNPPMIPSPTGVTATDDSETLTSIVADVITKTVYAVKRSGQEICGPTTSPCPAKPQVTPGDDVTFRIEKTIPSSDAESLTIQDWLPLPIFDVADPDADGTVGPPMSFSAVACGIPAPGQACLGPSNTLTVSPTLTSNVPTNSVTFNYGTFNDPTNTPRKIDLLFTLTATNDPFADGLFLTNQAQECEKNTFNMTFCQTAIAQVQMAEPKVRIIKGVVASDNPNAIFSPAAPPSGIFTSPGGSCPRFTGTINSSTIGSLNLNSNISGVDANDTVTFAIVVENLGTGPNGVFDVKIRDIFPLGPTDLPSCFDPDFSTLCVTDGTGTPIPFTVSPGGFGSVIIELTDPSPTQGALGPFHPTNGKNIAVLTFDAKLLPDVTSGCCDNRARLENYSNTENGPNFVAAGFGGPFEDTAQACVGPRPFAKCIQETSEAHTTPPSASQGGTANATIGEIVRYRLITVIPEGTTPSFQIQDFLPPGLTYLPGTARVLFVADSPVTSGAVTWPTVSGPNPPGCPGLPTPTASLLESGAPFTPGTGADPTFFVGAQALPITNNDNDPNLEFVIIELNAQVDNIASNQSSTTLANQFQVRFKDVAGNQFTSNSGLVNAHVVEPNLTIAKTVSPNPVVQGGTVTYTVTITNAGTADAFDVVFTDTLPAGLTPIAGSLTFPTGCTGTLVGQSISVACPTIPTGGSVTITYKAVANPATCPATLTNQAKVTWTSLPGPQGTCPNPTGSCTAGNSGAIDGERDGSTAPNLPNKYAAAASATLNVTCPSGRIVINKATVGGDGTFTFTGSTGLPGSFTITTTSGAGTQTFSNLTTPGTYTVTESAPPAGWTFTSLTCTDPTGNTTISGPTATIVLDPGETVTCTFTNTNCVDPSSLPNMVAWWPMDEPNGAAVVNDLAGFNNQGTPTPGSPLGAANAPNAVAGQVGGAIQFNPNLQANGPHLEVQDHSELNPGTGDLSIDAWVRVSPSPPTAGFIYPIVDKLVVTQVAPNIGTPRVGYAFYLDNFVPLARLRFTMADGNTVANYIGPGIFYNAWNHVVVTVDRTSGVVTFYVNGTPTAVTAPPMPTGSIDTPGTTLLIGESRLGLQAEITIDELEIFKHVLTPQEIQAIYNAGSKGKCKGQICVAKFEDLDGDGVQDTNEPLLGGWMFNVTDPNNNPVGTITTSPPGTAPACLNVAAPGTYTITEQVQSGWTVTTTNPQTVTVAPGQTVTVTFGNQGRAEICVFKFEDLNGNGVRDTNEPLLGGWQFTVSPAPLPPATSPVTTLPSGGICFGVSAPGTYTISEMIPPPPPTWTPTTPTSQTVTVQPSQLVNLFFGNKKEECDLLIRKSINPNPAQSGQPVTITLTVTNVGTGTCQPGPFPGTVVSDPRPSGLTFNLPVSITQSGGSANWACGLGVPTGDLSCATPDPLPPGYSATFTFTATVTAPPGSTIQNCATVTNQNDINSQNNQSCVTLQVTGCVTPPANMTAWWPLDETSGTTAKDLAGVPNNGTHVNGPTPTPGKVAGALRFDGVDDHVRVPDHAELNVGTGNFTLDAWVRTTASSGVVVLVDKRSGPTPLGYSLFLANGRLGFQMANGVGSSTCAPTPTPGVACVNYVATAPNVADGQWHHVAAVVDRANATSGVRLYVDGVQVFAGAPLTGNLDNTSDLYLGMRTPAQQGGGFFPGDLDEVELFKRALTPQEIQAIFQAGAAGKCKQVLFPDFVVSDLRVIPPGIPGGPVPVGSQVQVSFAIVNQGTGEAGSASHQIRLIAGGGPVAEVNVLLATVMTGSLAAGASRSFTQLVTIPRDVPTRSARIRVIADAPNGVSESEEGNNVAEFPITLIRPPGT